MIERSIFICDCYSLEHQICFTKWIDEEYPEDNLLTLEVHIKPESNLWKRFKLAIMYLFGHRSVYGDFDDFIFHSSDADKLHEAADFLKTCKQ